MSQAIQDKNDSVKDAFIKNSKEFENFASCIYSSKLYIKIFAAISLTKIEHEQSKDCVMSYEHFFYFLGVLDRHYDNTVHWCWKKAQHYYQMAGALAKTLWFSDDGAKKRVDKKWAMIEFYLSTKGHDMLLNFVYDADREYCWSEVMSENVTFAHFEECVAFARKKFTTLIKQNCHIMCEAPDLSDAFEYVYQQRHTGSTDPLEMEDESLMAEKQLSIKTSFEIEQGEIDSVVNKQNPSGLNSTATVFGRPPSSDSSWIVSFEKKNN